MNKVLDINEKAATCLLQPGVTYIDLYEELKRRGLGDKLWIDVPGESTLTMLAVEQGPDPQRRRPRWRFRDGQLPRPWW